MTQAAFRVAGVQMDIRLGEVDHNVTRMTAALQDPRAADAELVVFPECATTGYCFESRQEAWQVAESIPGPTTDRLQQVARVTGRYLAFGMLEREGESLFNSCVLLGPQGIIGSYRKIHLPFLGVDRFTTAGSGPLEVFEVGPLRVGLQICYDSSFPEATRILALRGADLIILPTNWPPGAEYFAEYIPNARAIENHIYFMVVNRVGHERGFDFIGHSKFCQPSGRDPCIASLTCEDVVSGFVEPAIARNKRLVRVPGAHVIDRFADRRPEFYQPLCQPHGLVRDDTSR